MQLGEYAGKSAQPLGVCNGKEETEEGAKEPYSPAKTRTETPEKKVELVWIPVLITASFLLFILRSNGAGSVKLGKYFNLAELTHTNTGLPNVPTGESVENLQYLVASVLDPLRERVGPLIVTSGFRSPAVNTAVGGSSSSQHMSGSAVDVVPASASIGDVTDALRSLPVDQVITYFDSNHIHISGVPNGRGEFLFKTSDGYIFV